MGVTGSLLNQAVIPPSFYSFTTWEKKSIDELFHRSDHELVECFAIRSMEFELLIGYDIKKGADEKGCTGRKLCKEIFQLFETRPGICDKFEVLCAITFLSNIFIESKISFLFDLFDFNKKGYLLSNEIKMLLVTSIKAAKNVDKLFIVPQVVEVISKMVSIALSKFALVDPQKSIRKPEFMIFLKETREIQSFLDAWKGHTSHIMVRDNSLWEDTSFVGCDTSISTTEEWLYYGLPPRGFIQWLRLPEMKNLIGMIGCTTMFSQTFEISQNVKNKGFWEGNGAMARGYLKQGLLADRYLLNGLVVCLSNNVVVHGLFIPTKQEELGR